MKTIITSTGNSIIAQFDLRFGRAGWYCIYDEDTKSFEFVENENKDANNGAGTKAAEKMVELGVKKVISGDFGPKAKDLLEQFNIQMVIVQNGELSVKNLIDKLK